MQNNHNYITFNDTIYQQYADLSQDGKASSILADLYLYYYERYTSTVDYILNRYVDNIIVFYMNN